MWFRGDNVTRNYTVDASHLGVKRLSTGELKLHKICWDRTFFFSTAKISEIKWFKKYTMIWRSFSTNSDLHVCKEAACTCKHCILLKMIQHFESES